MQNNRNKLNHGIELKKNSNIHPTAIVEKGAQIASDVVIEPYAVVKKNVTLEDGVVIKSHVYIDGYTTIGEGTVIWPSASIGTKTQDKKFRGEKTYVVVGKNCEVREFATINSSTTEGDVVRVGDNCLIMAYSHIAHNCVIGDNVIMSNNATLAGHVVVEDNAIVGGMTPVHQFVRIGCYAMVGGMSRVTHDVPPYTLGGGVPYKLGGLNIIGLKRHGFSYETRRLLSRAFRILYRRGYYLEEAIQCTREELEQTPEIKHWISFLENSDRGIIGMQGVALKVKEKERAGADLLEI
ncbi:acyl-ACP--UDP-N-acetylglucosamine O-acyltransferase [Simkania negevensis]|uniref:Acyl-[acyl-carrier-protein]--UDP-N-acetylglucosamine O-acyltransferase n=1 Tax=Simkania negevensis TaxID=83561 RepID=A0ABS3ASH2_9BACT|nr:acyl-ACP--UDP-N-acetylglucosamine O-acyltransferase [Simkania negevensis]